MVFKWRIVLTLILILVFICSTHFFGTLYHSNSEMIRNSEGFIRSQPADNLKSLTKTNRNYSNTRVSDCKPREVKLSRKPLPVTGLVSFPGAGNTWARHLIQQMTGLGTSSVYCDGNLKSHGFPFECHPQKQMTVVVKAHESVYFPRFKKVVLLIRNPFDALLAYAKFAKAGHTGHPSDKMLREASTKMFNGSLQWYINLTNRTIGKFKGPVYVLQFEKLKTDMVSELTKLARFLNISVTQSEIECTVKLQEGNFHRKSNSSQRLSLLRGIYSSENLEKMKDVARTTERMLKDAYKIKINVGGETESALFSN